MGIPIDGLLSADPLILKCFSQKVEVFVSLWPEIGIARGPFLPPPSRVCTNIYVHVMPLEGVDERQPLYF